MCGGRVPPHVAERLYGHLKQFGAESVAESNGFFAGNLDRDACVYALILVILLLRPTGLIKVKAVQERV